MIAKVLNGVKSLDISVNKLLAKIENELLQAKGSMNEARLREKVYSMKVLCELILEEPQKDSGSYVTVGQELPKVLSEPPVTLTQPRKIEMNEANGDSLLDF